MKIYMMRHGESVDDVENAYGGIANFPLTDAGRDQAKQLGQSLQGEGLQAIYSSPLARAEESARIVASQLDSNIEVIVVKDLRERNSYGVLSGINKGRAKEIFAEALAQLSQKPGYLHETVLGGEPTADFLQRVRGAFDYVVRDARQRGFTTFGVLTHGKFSKALYEEILVLSGDRDEGLSGLNILSYEPASVAYLKPGG